MMGRLSKKEKSNLRIKINLLYKKDPKCLKSVTEILRLLSTKDQKFNEWDSRNKDKIRNLFTSERNRTKKDEIIPRFKKIINKKNISEDEKLDLLENEFSEIRDIWDYENRTPFYSVVERISKRKTEKWFLIPEDFWEYIDREYHTWSKLSKGWIKKTFLLGLSGAQSKLTNKLFQELFKEGKIILSDFMDGYLKRLKFESTKKKNKKKEEKDEEGSKDESK